MTRNKISKKQQRAITDDLKSDIKKSVKNRVEKVSATISETVYSVTENRLNTIESNFVKNKKILFFSGIAFVLFICLVLFFSALSIEKHVKQKMLMHYNTQTELLANYKIALEDRLDSISENYQEVIYAKIEAEISSSSFENYITEQTNTRFDQLAPGMIEPLAKKYLETILLKMETKTEKTLDSLEREIIKKQSVPDENKSTALNNN